MTIQRSTPTGTARYVPPSGTPSADIFGLAAPSQSAPLGWRRQAPRYVVERTSNPDIYRLKVTIFDHQGGLDLQRGSLATGHDRISSSTLDTHYPEHVVLPPLTTAATTPDQPGTVTSTIGVFSAYVFGALIIATGDPDGSGNGPILFKETSFTDPTIASITYNPGATGNSPTALAALKINNASAPQLVLAMDGIASKVFSDAAGTVSATMHTDTTAADGFLQSPLPGDDNPVLIYAQGKIMTLASTVAATTQPTAQLTAVPQGGWAIGILGLGGAPVRAWWAWPNVTVAYPKGGTGYLGETFSPYYVRIVSTTVQGQNPQELTGFPFRTVRQAAIYRGGILATDGLTICHHNGRFVRNLRWNNDRPANSNRRRVIMGLYVQRQNELFIEVNEGAPEEVSTSSNLVTRWIEYYNWETDSWHQLSGTTTFATTSVRTLSYGAGSSLPFSESTGFIHNYVDGSWYRMRLPVPGENPYTLRKTSGAKAASGVQYEASGVLTSPDLTPEGMEGWQFCLRRIIGPPQENIDGFGTGGTPGSLAIAVADRQGNFNAAWTATFTAGKTAGRRPYQDFNSKQFAYEIAYKLTATQQSSGTDPTRQTGNCVPFTLEFDVRRPPSLDVLDFGDWTA